MKTIVSSLAALVLLGVALLAAPSPAYAQLTLDLTTGGGATTGLIPGAGGFVNFTGPLGNFAVNVTTGLSAPLVGTKSAGGTAEMDLSSVQVIKAGGPADSITIVLTDSGFMQTGPSSFRISVGGTLDAGITANYQAGKQFPTGGGPSLSLGPFGPFLATNGFSGKTSTGVTDSAPYSMFLIATLSFAAGGGTASFDFNAQDGAVPAPAGIVVALSGLPVLAGYWLRRRREQI